MKGHSLEVYDYITAVDAIKTIVEQGEGSSLCNPIAWNTEGGIGAFPITFCFDQLLKNARFEHGIKQNTNARMVVTRMELFWTIPRYARTANIFAVRTA